MERALLPLDSEALRASRRPRQRPDAQASLIQRRVLELQRSAGNGAVARALLTGSSPLLVAREKKKGGTAAAAARATRPAKTPATRLRKGVTMKKTAPKAFVPRRSQRVVTVPNAVDREIVWSGPAYGGVSSFAGGDSVTADLGPAASQSTSYGSTPGTNQCTAVNKLNSVAFQGKPWIKGHLLNDNLGGPGLSKNLTPLTHNANMAYKNEVESKVKNALTVCYSKGQGKGTHWYGVRFTAKITGKTWTHPASAAAGAVALTLDASCSYIRKPRGGGPVLLLTGKPFTTARDLPGPGVVKTNCFQ